MSSAAVLQMVWGQHEKIAAKTGVHGKPSATAEVRQAKVISGDLAFYRKYTEALLRRYLKMSMEAGRVPSMIGREMFRGRVTSYRVHSFEDVVVFVCDVEKCLKMLEPLQQRLIARVALQEYSQGEAATMLQLNLRTAVRKYNESLDRLTALFLERKLLMPMLESDVQKMLSRGEK